MLILAMLKIQVIDWRSLWSPPEAATFHDSDRPFEEGMCLKLGLHTPDFYGKGKKKKRKDLMVFPCLALETLREKAFVKHHLGQPGLATWLSQATRSEAKHGMEDLTKFSGRGLGDKVF